MKTPCIMSAFGESASTGAFEVRTTPCGRTRCGSCGLPYDTDAPLSSTAQVQLTALQLGNARLTSHKSSLLRYAAHIASSGNLRSSDSPRWSVSWFTVKSWGQYELYVWSTFDYININNQNYQTLYWCSSAKLNIMHDIKNKQKNFMLTFFCG